MTREERIDWLCRLRADLNNGVIFTPWNKEFTEALTEVLEPQPIRGHWEDCSNGWMCSNCGRDVSHESDFCPHCGADMRKSKGQEMTNSIEFPNSIYEFLLDNSFKDTDEVYTNGSMLIPTFRVKQAIEHYYEPCEDAISREAVLDEISDYNNDLDYTTNELYDRIKQKPSITPKQPFINKPCISEGVCHEDKVNVLKKIRAEIMQVANQEKVYDEKWAIGLRYAVKIIDKYKAESKVEE